MSTTTSHKIAADQATAPAAPSTSAHARAQFSRSVIKSVYADEVSEGVGAKVRRSIGTRELRHLSPFLMLDYFKATNGAGFPDHP